MGLCERCGYLYPGDCQRCSSLSDDDLFFLRCFLTAGMVWDSDGTVTCNVHDILDFIHASMETSKRKQND